MKMKTNSTSSLALGLVVLFFVFTFAAVAQVATTGQVVGSVQDSSGAAVPGVTLRLQNAGTKVIQSVTSGSDGGFVFSSVLPGAYDLTVTNTGFDTAVYQGIVVNAARTTNQPVTLKVGAVTETVQVTGAAPALQTSSTTISAEVSSGLASHRPRYAALYAIDGRRTAGRDLAR
jgi:hypothetical protein